LKIKSACRGITSSIQWLLTDALVALNLAQPIRRGVRPQTPRPDMRTPGANG
jgi:hypothetical protein